jgi:GT2 family glycosyltransferase
LKKSSARHLTHTIVVCSRNRPKLLIACINSLFALDRIEDVQILVIENSESELDFKLVSDELSSNQNAMKVRIVRNRPGLAKSRNTALSLVETDLVTFIDDDVTLPFNFIDSTNLIFQVNEDAVGVSPRIKNLYKINLPTRPYLLGNALRKIKVLLLSVVEGKILYTGHSFWFSDETLSNSSPQWLPGCCMTYRMELLGGMKFQEALENGPTRGYALGEDVDFSNRSRGVGRLLINKDISVDHARSNLDRGSNPEMERAIGTWLAFMTRNVGKVKFAAVLVYLIVRIPFVSIKRFLREGRFTLRGVGISRVSAFISEIRRPSMYF